MSPIARLVKWALAVFFRLRGWTVEGSIPPGRKCVIIAAPHTSNWDFPLMLFCGLALGVWPAWVGKHTLFRAPFGPVMRWLGGIAVNREAGSNAVASMPLAPGRLSTMNCCFMFSPIFAAIARALMSVEAPGA